MPFVEANVLGTPSVVSLPFVLGIAALPAAGVLVKSSKKQPIRQFMKFAVQTQFREQIDVRRHMTAQQLRPLQVSHPDQAKMLMR